MNIKKMIGLIVMSRNQCLYSVLQLKIHISENYREEFLLPYSNAVLLPVTTAPWVHCRHQEAVSHSSDSLKPAMLLSGVHLLWRSSVPLKHPLLIIS